MFVLGFCSFDEDVFCSAFSSHLFLPLTLILELWHWCELLVPSFSSSQFLVVVGFGGEEVFAV